MKFAGTLLMVEDVQNAKEFYENVMGQKLLYDFGACQQFESGLSLQAKHTWQMITGINADALQPGGDCMELYFEADDFDAFLEKLKAQTVRYVHHVAEYEWGQRSIAFYDPDGYIIDVGESMESTAKRLIDQGMTQEQIAQKMDCSIEYVKEWLK